MANNIYSTCPGRGESSRKLCICGAVIYKYRGYERTAQLRTYNADGTVHECPALRVPDTLECTCHQMIYCYQDGRRLNMDGTVHTCPDKPIVPATQHTDVRIVHVPTVPIAALKPGGNGHRHTVPV